MPVTASISDGVLLLSGTPSSQVVVNYGPSGLVTITEGGAVVAITGADQPVLSIDPAVIPYSSYGVTVVGSSTGDVLRVKPVESGSSISLIIDGGGGQDALVLLDDPSDTSIRNYTITRIETLTGSAGGDFVALGNAGGSLTVTGGVESLLGGTGIDNITLGHGDDVLLTVSIESLDAGAGNDQITLGNRGTTVTFQNAETIIGGVGIDNITVTAGATSLNGGGGDDILICTSANDTINGGAGIDRLTGGGGQDLFIGTSFDFSGDTITDFSIGDVITVTDGVEGQMAASLAGSTLTIDPDGTGGTGTSVTMNLSAVPLGRLEIRGKTIIFLPEPAPTVSVAAAGPLVAGVPATVTFRFSEPVANFSLEDVTATNGALANLVQLDVVTYAATFTPAAAGETTIAVAAGSYEDLSQDVGGGSSYTAPVIDYIAPTVSITSPATAAMGVPVTVTFSFSEAVQGFTLQDVVAANGTLSSLVQVDATHYRATFTPTAAGIGSLLVVGGSYTDASGNLGSGAWKAVTVQAAGLNSIGSNGVERMYGTSLADSLSGRGGNDVLDGGWGNDRIWGGSGNDKMYGGLGRDLLKGESGNDTLKGDDDNDTLWGGAGNDILAGGEGKDTFVFDLKPSRTKNRDKVLDFDRAADSIWLENKVFTKFGKKGSEMKPAKLNKKFFTMGDKAKDKNDYLIYDTKKGMLFYDADGSGKAKAVEIASLSKGLKLTASDFFVV
ncbi:Ig-like domain-containing protein [Microvirga roseola]|uniref:Ig-like domain-containing protein n=1 Tax=Microvirga roseola TaxID=2883126 RepID=UPI001E2A116C|nr:Ig-like domain-containing protein [Microvirga roseola]